MTKPKDTKIDDGHVVLHKRQAFQIGARESVIDWLANLKDRRARAKLIDRIARLADGNKGDWKSIRESGGVCELRIDAYRVYYIQQGNRLMILLLGGDKSTQKRDIAKAKLLALESKQYGKDRTL